MTAIDHTALEAAARAATQGEWAPQESFDEEVTVIAGPYFVAGECSQADAAYIVAAQPSVILALLEERKRLVEALRILVLDARPANWNDGDDENAEYAWRRADAALAGEKEPKP